MTFDELYILTARKADLAAMGGLVTMNLDEARAAGIIKTDPKGGSKVQRIRKANAEKKAAEKKQSKRDRRREYDRNLKEARARGENV